MLSSRIYRTDSELKKHQITTLKVFNDNVTEVKEGSEYHVLFNCGGTTFTLIVTLTADFPKDRPILKVSPIIVHPWVNTDGEVTSAPGLLNYNTVHSDLGRVVQAVIREFTSNITSPIRDCEAIGRQNFSPPHVHQAIAFPELNSLPLDELKFLYESAEQRQEFLENLPQIRETNKTLDDFIAQVEELADSNLSKEDKLAELRRDIEERIEEVTKLAFENERLNTVFQNLSDRYSPKNIKDMLKRAAEETNVESERIADAFLQGKMDVDEFISLYLQTRTLSQARKTKEEKLAQQLHSLEQAGF